MEQHPCTRLDVPNPDTNTHATETPLDSPREVSATGVIVPEKSVEESDTEAHNELSTAQSLRSSSSTETFASFTSATSMQSNKDTIDLLMTSIKSVIHAFKVAVETLQSLVDKRFTKGDQVTYLGVKDLEVSLADGIVHIDQRNESYCARYGQSYIEAFKEPGD